MELAPAAGVHSFHLRADQRQIIQQVFKAYGIEATVDESVRTAPARLDVDNVSFETAARIVGMVTDSFYVPLDAHRALVARDTKENRQQFTRLELETVYLPGLSDEELTDVGNLAKNVFDAQQAVAEPDSGTITIRAPAATLNAFNATMSELLDGRSQVLLEVRMIQLAHTSAAQHRSAAAADHVGLQRLYRGTVHPERQPEPGAADHLLGPGRARRHAGDSRHSAGIRPGLQFPVLQRRRPLWRRADAIRAGSGLASRPTST